MDKFTETFVHCVSSFINWKGICLGRQSECHGGHFNREQLVLKEQSGGKRCLEV